ncbi:MULTISPECIES: DUF3593 domain-containing protein [Thiorhodovibrio]|uniref:DUF3593 domain-containing protein n=1 Tax=Thiorhodovibrio TaxID=61593 RepID=UPI001911E275|nr:MULTISPECIES: DUF3593 domain-containing protein [Thiorhodovibrio]MBK5968503.1 hypothetical protein [Thiorhodovibrio winogradskyi]WPL13447.1 hypothetical protein Thiosp_03248 [Thiorhodovibrio litoralis]
MLLSLPTAIIHLLTVSEWLAALLFFHRYAVVAGFPQVRRFAYAMLPHLAAGLMVLSFHASGDRAHWLLEGARLMTFLGSLALLSATFLMVRTERVRVGWFAAMVFVIGMMWGVSRLWVADGMTALLPGANLAYLGFLALLVVVHRQTPGLFSPLSIAGFWFLLVFVAGAIAAMRLATVQLGLPSLSHADALHGASESLLSVSNFLIALGAYRKLRSAQIEAVTE